MSPRRENTPSFICNAYITFVVYFRTNAITWRLTSSSSSPARLPPSRRCVLFEFNFVLLLHALQRVLNSIASRLSEAWRGNCWPLIFQRGARYYFRTELFIRTPSGGGDHDNRISFPRFHNYESLSTILPPMFSSAILHEILLFRNESASPSFLSKYWKEWNRWTRLFQYLSSRYRSWERIYTLLLIKL